LSKTNLFGVLTLSLTSHCANFSAPISTFRLVHIARPVQAIGPWWYFGTEAFVRTRGRDPNEPIHFSVAVNDELSLPQWREPRAKIQCIEQQTLIQRFD
jgi:hypothetical protein